MASNNAISISLPHPLFDAETVDGGNYRDGLNNCAAVLWALADLFEPDELPASLESPRARRGVFLQLQGVASTLESIGEFLSAQAAHKRELDAVEREALRRAVSEEEDRVSQEPDVIRKRAIIAGAMADVIRETFDENSQEKVGP